MCGRIGECISLELFYFVSLTSSCSLIPFVHPVNHDGHIRAGSNASHVNVLVVLIIYMYLVSLVWAEVTRQESINHSF